MPQGVVCTFLANIAFCTRILPITFGLQWYIEVENTAISYEHQPSLPTKKDQNKMAWLSDSSHQYQKRVAYECADAYQQGQAAAK